MATTAAAPTPSHVDPAGGQDLAAAAATASAAPAAPAGEAQAQPPLVQECWSSAFDFNSHRWYFYNTATGQTQWEPPPGWLPPQLSMPPPVLPRPLLHPAHAAAMAAAAHAAAAHQLALASSSSPQQLAAQKPPSDATNDVQQLEAPAAPASEGETGFNANAPAAAAASRAPLAIVSVGPHPVSTVATAAAATGYCYRDAYGVMQGPFTKEQLAAWRGALPMDLMVSYRSGDSQGPGAHTHSLELAKVLGDGELLARWRDDNPAKAAVPGSAPTAEEFEKDLATGSSYSAYAEAALAGLPAHDDAVQIARMAAFSGRSIQDLLAFNYGSGGVGDYTTTALHSSGRGRVQAADAQGEGLYDEMGRWADASTLEQQLARAAEQRRRGVSGKELQALRARKLEMKRKKQIEWLTR